MRVLMAGVPLGLGALLLAAPSALAHGEVPAGPPTVTGLLLGWSLEPLVVLGLLGAGGAWLALVRRVDRAHPASPVPRRRSVAFLGGLAAIAVALLSGIEAYDTTLFSVHMVQHLVLTLVAAPLLALGAPITTLLRAATPATRRRVILPILHSRVLRVVGFPVVAWLAFAAVMWGSHFSPLFDASLESPVVHDLEHALYLGAGLLFWWPAVGLDPSPWRMAHPVRLMYVFLQMPQNTFLAVTILGSGVPLYAHYATLTRSWGPSPLEDQQIAGSLMWLGGDLLFLAALAAILAGWMRHEQRGAAAGDRRVDRERALLREREARLAERVAGEREGRG
ncbi:MAG TPA: cytochrome c oxidase assembly protein [Candidatus Limnocylindrales bacterium]|nr:cytochrome c oxidase assembly protein [Candidatus Limnocylindrales bacterium]